MTAPTEVATTAHLVHELVTALPADRRPARANGRLVFGAPWEARALGLAAALRAAGVDPVPALTAGLAGTDPDGDPTAYWTAWLDALVVLAATAGVAPDALAGRTAVLADEAAHDHDREHAQEH